MCQVLCVCVHVRFGQRHSLLSYAAQSNWSFPVRRQSVWLNLESHMQPGHARRTKGFGIGSPVASLFKLVQHSDVQFIPRCTRQAHPPGRVSLGILLGPAASFGRVDTPTHHSGWGTSEPYLACRCLLYPCPSPFHIARHARAS